MPEPVVPLTLSTLCIFLSYTLALRGEQGGTMPSSLGLSPPARADAPSGTSRGELTP